MVNVLETNIVERVLEEVVKEVLEEVVKKVLEEVVKEVLEGVLEGVLERKEGIRGKWSGGEMVIIYGVQNVPGRDGMYGRERSLVGFLQKRYVSIEKVMPKKGAKTKLQITQIRDNDS